MRTEIEKTSFPRILVLLASYNGKAWLQEQLKSILEQECVIVSIQISDDASTDGTEEFIKAEYGHEARVMYNRWPTPSGSAGANFRRLYRTADLNGFDYVALADQDDIWDKQKMTGAVHAMSQSGAAGYSCAVESFWPDGRTRVLSQASIQRGADFLFEGAGQGCTFVIRQDLFQQAQKFCIEREEDVALLHYHDWLLYLLARAWGKAWYFDQTPYMRYRQHGGNEIGARGSIGAVTKRLRLISSGWYKSQVTAAVRVFRLANNANASVNYLHEQLLREDSFTRRFNISRFVLKNGRRKASERLLMAASAAAGLI
jgi:rhamnosyltransferase